MSGPTVIGALRKFLPAYCQETSSLAGTVRRAIWAITHCRTPALGGQIYACEDCGKPAFAYHSCNHRSCPQCGRSATARWVQRELGKRVGAPYFMVTFTLPAELRGLFFGPQAREAYDLFFAATSRALAEKLEKDRTLRASDSGFTGVLHTWNQRLGFHPHIHYIVPGAGIDFEGKVRTVNNANFLIHLPLIRQAFRWHFARELEARHWQKIAIDPAVWQKDWGVHIQAFGDGANAIKYLGTYVCRSVIADSRIVAIGENSVTYRWKDRNDHDRVKVDTIAGVEFVRRYLRHVLPRRMRAIRYFGFCHPAARAKRERVAFHTGRGLKVGPIETALPSPSFQPRCPCCQGLLKPVMQIPRQYGAARAPPSSPLTAIASAVPLFASTS